MKLIDDYNFKILYKLEFSKQLSFTDLIKTVKNRSTLSNRLKFLLRTNLIFQEKGVYRLQDRGLKILNLLKQVKNILEMEESYENFDSIPFVFRDYLYNFINTVKENFQEKLLSVVLFGSIARGKWTKDSDIDLFLVFSNESSQNMQLLVHKLAKIKVEFYKAYTIKSKWGKKLYNPIQMLPFLMRDLKESKTIFYDVAMDGLILLDKKKVGSNFLEAIKLKMKNLGLTRIFDINGNFYWQHKKIKFGEIIEI